MGGTGIDVGFVVGVGAAGIAVAVAVGAPTVLVAVGGIGVAVTTMTMGVGVSAITTTAVGATGVGVVTQAIVAEITRQTSNRRASLPETAVSLTMSGLRAENHRPIAWLPLPQLNPCAPGESYAGALSFS